MKRINKYLKESINREIQENQERIRKDLAARVLKTLLQNHVLSVNAFRVALPSESLIEDIGEKQFTWRFKDEFLSDIEDMIDESIEEHVKNIGHVLRKKTTTFKKSGEKK